MTARDAPRVPFAALVERGLVTPGAILVDGKRRHKALVRADGAISLGASVGSIHRIGALAQGLDACNGWTFWHVETPKGLRLIDELRAEIRAEMEPAEFGFAAVFGAPSRSSRLKRMRGHLAHDARQSLARQIG